MEEVRGSGDAEAQGGGGWHPWGCHTGRVAPMGHCVTPLGSPRSAPKSGVGGGSGSPSAVPHPQLCHHQSGGAPKCAPQPQSAHPTAPPDPKSRGSRTQHHPGVPPHGFLSWGGGTRIPLWAGGGPAASPLSPGVPAVMLTGGIVAVAGQFKGWYFAVYAMYPFFLGGGTAGRPLPQFGTRRGGPHKSSLPKFGPKSLRSCPIFHGGCTRGADPDPPSIVFP